MPDIALDLRYLKYAVVAAEHGSFRRAAKALRVQQSSVSRAIRRLEVELGVSLFERRSAGAHLTDAGRRFLSDVVPAIEQLELAKRAAAAAGRVEIGVVRVGILTSLAGGFLRELVRSYAVRHPRISGKGSIRHYEALEHRGDQLCRFRRRMSGLARYDLGIGNKVLSQIANSPRAFYDCNNG